MNIHYNYGSLDMIDMEKVLFSIELILNDSKLESKQAVVNSIRDILYYASNDYII